MRAKDTHHLINWYNHVQDTNRCNSESNNAMPEHRQIKRRAIWLSWVDCGSKGGIL